MTTPALLGHVDVRFLEDNARSKNKRLYTREAVDSAVEAATADLVRGVPITVFATHADGLADDASKMAGRVDRVWRAGTQAKARLSLFATETGRNLAAVLKGGGLTTCSLRSNDFATGDPVEIDGERCETVTRVRLAGIDFTLSPGLAVAGVDRLALEGRGGAPRLIESVPMAVETWELGGLAMEAVTKKEADGEHPASDYAYTPDRAKPSTWKLRIDTARNVAGAAASFSKGGFRGKRVRLPASAVAAVKRKVRAAWRKFYPEKSADAMPDSLKESAATEAIYVELPDWDACIHCRNGEQDECECPGCANDGPCWCCAVLAADEDETTEGDMTKDEVQKLIDEALKAQATKAATEAVHTHVHEHEGMDGESYSHEHSHRHEGTADHEDPSAHLHGHGVTWEALLHVSPDRLVEAAVAALKQQQGALKESGRTLSAATLTKLRGVRSAAHSGVCEALDALCGAPADAAAEGTVRLQAALTETLEKQRTLTEQLSEQAERIKVLEGVNARLTESWREKPKVPREALLPALPEETQAELKSPGDRIHYWAESVSKAVARQGV